MSLVAWLQEHRRSVLFLLFVLAVGGVASVSRLPVGLFPHVSFPRIVVNVDAGFSAGYAAAVVNKLKEKLVHHGEHGAHGGRKKK